MNIKGVSGVGRFFAGLVSVIAFFAFFFFSAHIALPDGQSGIPADFPAFSVPGYENEMNSLRELYWLHYGESAPQATLWDEWLLPSSLWPALKTNNQMNAFKNRWGQVLSNRDIDKEGYVSTHQHPSISHQKGWPFPFWNQGSSGVFGWHFSFKDTVPPPFRSEKLSTGKDWILENAEDKGINENGWLIKLKNINAAVITPLNAFIVDSYQSPFVQLRWKGNLPADSMPFVEWSTTENPGFTPERRMYFDPVTTGTITYTMIPLYKNKEWNGKNINQFRICFGNTAADTEITIQAFFSQYDTRHNINGQSYVTACVDYFFWTGDIDFLRDNINRMRSAMHYIITEHKTLEKKAVYTNWTGHEGRSGIQPQGEGKPNRILSGNGIGSNYWDLLPFGNMDCYATIRFYGALKKFAEVEKEIADHPQWNIPGGVLKFDPDFLLKHAEVIKNEGNKIFWNKDTQRFVSAIDADGKKHDYGFTFVNLEAIYYDFAVKEHAEKIIEWMDGKRIIQDDTSQGSDIYHWRFAPRATTKRNVDYYVWSWNNPQSIKFGDQIQDGGAVLGFSYHDLMARLKINGADDCWSRLKEILNWFDEVKSAGGYRKYYNGSRDGSLQGGGTPGGLGLDNEFFESVMVQQIMLDGFLGFKPEADGFSINPRLPKEWKELTINRIHFRNLILKVKAGRDLIEITKEEDLPQADTHSIRIPEGRWNVRFLDENGKEIKTENTIISTGKETEIQALWKNYSVIKIKRI